MADKTRENGDTIAEHADSLRSTRDAQQKAREILDVALTLRQDATEEAEQIVLEARGVAEQIIAEAERSRDETAEWVKAQREDVEQIRAAAIRSAAVRAEQTRREVSETLARGAREAHEIRSQAHDLLVFAKEIAAGIQTSVEDTMRVVDGVRSGVRDQLAAFDGLDAEAGHHNVDAAFSEQDADSAEPAVTEHKAGTLGRATTRTPVQGGSLGAMFRDAGPRDA